MGFFDSLFGKSQKVEKKAEKIAAVTAADSNTAMNIDAQGISPEVVAAIGAAIYAMMGADSVLSVRITRPGNQWAAAGRQKLMDGRQVI
ncbi:OadG family protein|uniref:Oxaloacetate decarboxylase, gamma chain n=1 Tax=Dendrosporobacter quercicolus TaxID=146817 RepID=A0A1G9VE63_9FIRM|nr:OadG family protein [Dendrosporobacter quercicolus]NSL47839.1 OadG family protein [Dendrosporobacter quercicolus DSM 1736]SDM70337.1 Oxaloacetate decarboxylase, gamma chain [Dendrosporobacter quercicolus]